MPSSSVVTVGPAVAGSTGVVTVPWPASYQLGDVLVVYCESVGAEPIAPLNHAGLGAMTSTGYFRNTGTGTAGTRLTYLFVKAWSTSMPSMTFNSPGDHHYYLPILLRNLQPYFGNAMLLVNGGNVKATASTAVSWGTVNTIANDSISLLVATRDTNETGGIFSGWTGTGANGLAEIFDAGTALGNGGGLGVAYFFNDTATTTGVLSATTSSSTINAYSTHTFRGLNGAQVGWNTDPQWVSSKETVSSTPSTTHTLGLPETFALNDVLIAQVTSNVTANDFTFPGWTPFVASLNTGTGLSTRLFWRAATADGNDTTAVTLQLSSQLTAVVAAYRGASPTNPIDVVATAGPTVSQTAAYPTINTVSTYARPMRGIAWGTAGMITNVGSGHTTRGEACNGTNGHTLLGDAKETPLTPAGNVPTVNAITLAPSSTWYCIAFALRRGWGSLASQTVVGITSITEVTGHWLQDLVQTDTLGVTSVVDSLNPHTDYVDSVTTTVAAITSVSDTRTPTGVAGCTAWFDTSIQTEAHGAAITLVDRSGNGNNATYLGPGSAPIMYRDPAAGPPWHYDGTYGTRIRTSASFSRGGGCLRFNSGVPTGTADISVFLVSRVWDTNNGGRTLANATDTAGNANVLVGSWGAFGAGSDPACFDNGWLGTQAGIGVNPIPWRVYNLNCKDSPRTSEFWIWNGNFGTHNTSTGHGATWQINGYKTPDAAATDETCNGEICEIIVYNRYLTGAERDGVAKYLADKWYWHATYSVASTDNTFGYIQAETTVTDVLSHAQAYTDSVVTTVTAADSIAVTFGQSVSVQTDVTMIQSLTDTMGAVEALSSVIIGVTTLDVLLSLSTTIQTDIVGSTGATEFLGRYDDLLSIITSVTTVTAIQGMYEVLTPNIVVGVTYVDEQMGGNLSDNLTTTVVGVTSISEGNQYGDDLVTTIVGLTGETDQLNMYLDIVTTVVGITTIAAEILGRYENVQTDILATDTVTSVAVLVSVVLTIINAQTTELDMLNGEAPAVGLLLYQAGPFKVMGKM